MGTRNLTMVVKNKKTKVAQYGQWDGYPSGQGRTILEFLKTRDLKKFADQLEKVSFYTKEEYEKVWEEIKKEYPDSENWKHKYPQL